MSAEEIEADGEPRPPACPPCDPVLARRASRALVYLAGGNEAAERVWDELAELGGGEMAVAAHALVLCAREVRRRVSRAAGAPRAQSHGTERKAA